MRAEIGESGIFASWGGARWEEGERRREAEDGKKGEEGEGRRAGWEVENEEGEREGEKERERESPSAPRLVISSKQASLG